MFYYDKSTRQYWRENPYGEFVPTTERDLKRHFKANGIFVDEFDPTNSLTTYDKAICNAQNEDPIDHVITISGHPVGIYETGEGKKILVPKSPKLIHPKPGSWENFQSFLIQLFGSKQHEYVMGWLKVALEDLRTLNPKSWRYGQMLALAGRANCGKSFFQRLVTALLGGSSADPYLWMVGESNFNEHLAESAHLMMEDKHARRDAKSRSDFGTAIKQLTASNDLAVHGKGKKQFTVLSFRRLTISLNDDADYVTALPMLDPSMQDKLMLLKCSHANMVENRAENYARFERELPAFADYLLNNWQIPEPLRDIRFGIKHFHNPELLEVLQLFDPHLQFQQLIDDTLFQSGRQSVERVKASEIERRLVDGPYGRQAQGVLRYNSACGVFLSRLCDEEPSRFEKTRSKGATFYTIHAPEELSL